MHERLTTRFAQIGLSAKGMVYVVIGVMIFMAAFELGGQRESDATRSGAFTYFQKTGGTILLSIVAAGLICYVLWRISRALSGDEKVLKRIRYFISALAYGSVAYSAIRMILKIRGDNGDQNQQLAADLLSRPMGEWLLVVAALIFASIGGYQVYYGWSKKYRKHVSGMNLQQDVSSLLLRMGRFGYIARGVVWLILAFLLMRAAISQNASDAGDTGRAFRLIENEQWGSLVLSLIGVGLLGYGVFSFLRARYEKL